MGVQDTFKRGDVVQLTSGGPIMTIHDHRDPLSLLCKWFEAGKLKEGRFPGESLVRYEGKR